MPQSGRGAGRVNAIVNVSRPRDGYRFVESPHSPARTAAVLLGPRQPDRDPGSDLRVPGSGPSRGCRDVPAGPGCPRCEPPFLSERQPPADPLRPDRLLATEGRAGCDAVVRGPGAAACRAVRPRARTRGGRVPGGVLCAAIRDPGHLRHAFAIDGGSARRAGPGEPAHAAAGQGERGVAVPQRERHRHEQGAGRAGSAVRPRCDDLRVAVPGHSSRGA